MKKPIKIVDEKLYIFIGASEREIEESMPKGWTENGLYYINCKDEVNFEQALRIWNTVKRKVK